MGQGLKKWGFCPAPVEFQYPTYAEEPYNRLIYGR
jgi:hypothetical protein